MVKSVNDIAKAIDADGKVYDVFPIWQGESLAKLTDQVMVTFKIMLGDLYEDYTLLDHNQVIIHKATGEAD